MKNFWNDIDNWSTNDDQGATLHDTVDNHEAMYEECVRFTGWVPETSEETDLYTEKIRKITPTMRHRKPNFRPSNDRWFAIPDEKNFPSIYEFLQKNSHQYFGTIISKMGPGCWLLPHTHGSYAPDGTPPAEEYLYNMSLNYPDGCKFAVYSRGIIPFRAGDIYKIDVTQYHAVSNDSKSDRYHLMMRNKKFWEWAKKTLDISDWV
jgi:hypothetical protein